MKIEKERARSLITGNCSKYWDGTLDLDAVKCALVIVVNSNNYNTNKFENYCPILPVISATANFPTLKSIADEFALNREQLAAFMIITSHFDDGSRWCTGNLYNADHHISKCVIFLDENNDQLIMSIPAVVAQENLN